MPFAPIEAWWRFAQANATPLLVYQTVVSVFVLFSVANAIGDWFTLRFRQALWAVITHPLGWGVTLAIAANSARLAYSSRGHAWKGRVYRK